MYIDKFWMSAPAPLGPMFFIFMHFLKIRSKLIGWDPHFGLAPPPWEILDLPLQELGGGEDTKTLPAVIEFVIELFALTFGWDASLPKILYLCNNIH